MGRKAEPMDWTPDCGQPGPEEIRAACERIRSAWSPAERARRKVTPDEPVETRVVAVSDISSAPS
jgi:hypothetical protein